MLPQNGSVPTLRAGLHPGNEGKATPLNPPRTENPGLLMVGSTTARSRLSTYAVPEIKMCTPGMRMKVPY